MFSELKEGLSTILIDGIDGEFKDKDPELVTHILTSFRAMDVLKDINQRRGIFTLNEDLAGEHDTNVDLISLEDSDEMQLIRDSDEEINLFFIPGTSTKLPQMTDTKLTAALPRDYSDEIWLSEILKPKGERKPGENAAHDCMMIMIKSIKVHENIGSLKPLAVKTLLYHHFDILSKQSPIDWDRSIGFTFGGALSSFCKSYRYYPFDRRKPHKLKKEIQGYIQQYREERDVHGEFFLSDEIKRVIHESENGTLTYSAICQCLGLKKNHLKVGYYLHYLVAARSVVVRKADRYTYFTLKKSKTKT